MARPDSSRTQRQRRKSVLLRYLPHLPHYLRCRHFFCPHVSGRKGRFSHQECSLRRFDLMNKRVLPLHIPEYCPWTRIGIDDGGTPPMRFGKSLDLPLSFCTFEFFRGQQRSGSSSKTTQNSRFFSCCSMCLASVSKLVP